MDPKDAFDCDNLSHAEALLMAQQIARDYFQGELYQRKRTACTI